MAVYKRQTLRNDNNIFTFCTLVDEFKQQKTKAEREKRIGSV